MSEVSQISLDYSTDPCRNRHGGNPESLAAWRSADRTGLRGKCLDLCSRPGGATTDEIAVALNRPPNSISGRLTELKALGLIEPASRRLTSTGRWARAWRAKV